MDFKEFQTQVINKIKNNQDITFDVFERFVIISQYGNYYIRFYKNGDICIDNDIDDELCIAENRTYEQMLMIIEGLL